MKTQELNKVLEILISYKNKFLFSPPDIVNFFDYIKEMRKVDGELENATLYFCRLETLFTGPAKNDFSQVFVKLMGLSQQLKDNQEIDFLEAWLKKVKAIENGQPHHHIDLGKYDPDFADLNEDEIKEEQRDMEMMISVKTSMIIQPFINQVSKIEQVFSKYLLTIRTSVYCLPERPAKNKYFALLSSKEFLSDINFN